MRLGPGRKSSPCTPANACYAGSARPHLQRFVGGRKRINEGPISGVVARRGRRQRGHFEIVLSGWPKKVRACRTCRNAVAEAKTREAKEQSLLVHRSWPVAQPGGARKRRWTTAGGRK